MVNLNKSFLYGICFASLTWIVSLYLYFQITNTENSTKKPVEHTLWTDEQIKSKSLAHKLITDLKRNTQNKKKWIEHLKPVRNRNQDKIDDGKS